MSRGIALLFLGPSELDGGGGSAPRPGCLYPPERPCTHCTGGWVGPRTGLDGRKISSLPGFDPGPSSPQSVAILTELHGPLTASLYKKIGDSRISGIDFGITCRFCLSRNKEQLSWMFVYKCNRWQQNLNDPLLYSLHVRFFVLLTQLSFFLKEKKKKSLLKINKIDARTKMPPFVILLTIHSFSDRNQFVSFGGLLNPAVTPYMSQCADSCLRSSHVSVSQVIQ